MDRRKLLLVFPSTVRGGVEEYTLKIASAAVAEGWDVHVAFPQVEGTVSLVHDFTNKSIKYHPLNIAEISDRNCFKTLNHLFRFIKTFALLQKVQPALIQINLPYTNYCFGSIIACGLLKIHTVVVFQLVPSHFIFSSLKKRLLAWARSRNQQWVAVSRNNQAHICSSFDVPSSKVLCIYNGVSFNLSSSVSCSKDSNLLRHKLIEELCLPDQTLLLLTVGRLSYQKGYDVLVPVIPYIVKDFPDATFIWVGEGEQRRSLTSKLHEYNVENKVRFLGFRSDVSCLLKAADLFVFPTLFEGQPFAILEAMASGLPIVTSSASGIPEVIENKVHGLTCRVGDSCDLLESIRWALKHPQDMQEMAQAAKLRVQEFTEDKMISETFNLWYSFKKV